MIAQLPPYFDAWIMDTKQPGQPPALEVVRTIDMKLKGKLPSQEVVDVRVTALRFTAQIDLIMRWAKMRESKFVCVANTHMLVEAHRSLAFANVLKKADLITPDGMPLVWMVKHLGKNNQDRVAGLDIMLAVCDDAAAENVSVFLFGSVPEVLERIKIKFQQDFPNLQVVGSISPPFRPLTAEDNAEIVRTINDSGAGIVLVALGCPKQEIWMAKQQGKLQGVMIGLGGAFPVYAGLKSRTPRWLQKMGLEWLYRLIQEPKRLWKRYSTTIPVFVWRALKQLVMPQ